MPSGSSGDESMTSASGTASLPPPSSRVRKSLSNRIGSIFSSKKGQINEYHIKLHQPHKTYGPGDTVKGAVVLDVARPLGVTHVVVCLYGFLQVFKNHRSSKAGHRNAGGRVNTGGGKRWVTEYYGDGYAALFEEEVVLCGEGRLDPKLYHFQFELDFPTNFRLPSSIEFERGTISYIVSSSITRPSSISPTTNCEARVTYRDDIDVSALPVPKPRAITLEPEARRSKARSPMKRLASYDSKRKSYASVASPSERSGYTAKTSASRDEVQSSRPPSPSAASSRSSMSSRRKEHGAASEPQSSQTSQSPKTESERRSKTITASVGLSKAGCLPGELVPLRISVSHHKVIRSFYGVIVTLYRQACVDMHPNLPLRRTDGGEAKYEDYYPRSKTGLGGLSLSAAGSSQEWRKDLSQTFSPLYIDPHTLEAEVKVAVRVPDNAFPSIRNAPGEMISFKYMVEVIIDINGKLASHEKGFASLGLMGVQSSYGISTLGQATDLDHSVTAYGTSCIDTSRIRREKNAIVCLCDLVVGTRDSRKSKGKQPSHVNSRHRWSYPERLSLAVPSGDSSRAQHQAHSIGSMNDYDDRYWYQHWRGPAQWNEAEYGYADFYPSADDAWSANDRGPDVAPPPAARLEENLSEKQRLARLMPSEPPDFRNAPNIAEPTAPNLAAGVACAPSASHIEDYASSSAVNDFASVIAPGIAASASPDMTVHARESETTDRPEEHLHRVSGAANSEAIAQSDTAVAGFDDGSTGPPPAAAAAAAAGTENATAEGGQRSSPFDEAAANGTAVRENLPGYGS